MIEWNSDMDAAPRDGTPILVHAGRDGFYTEAGQVGVALWRRQAFSAGKMCWCAQDCCDGVTTYDPSHWARIEPPK